MRFAVQYGQTRIVQLLIEHGADVNMRFAQNKTMLHQACYGTTMTCFVLRYVCLLYVCPLSSCTQNADGNQEICKLLLEAGHEPNPLCDAGFSPNDLVYCPKEQTDHLRQFLQSHGANRARTVPELKIRTKVIFSFKSCSSLDCLRPHRLLL